MSTLHNLVAACQADDTQLRQLAQARTENWQPWLAPVTDTRPNGEDPGYDDDFQRIREEVNKLSGIDTGLICSLAEKLLTTTAKDIRVAAYYCWARLHQNGETGFAEGLELLAGLLQRYGTQLHPQRERSRKPALEWLAGSRVLDSLSLWPEVVRDNVLSAIPASDAEGKTRIEPPRADQRAMLKRLYLQQSWLEILEQADSTFSRGANHLWLDLQWYIHQALMKSGQDVLADVIAADLKGLQRLLMARVAEQKGKNQLALHLLGELDSAAPSITTHAVDTGTVV